MDLSPFRTPRCPRALLLLPGTHALVPTFPGLGHQGLRILLRGQEALDAVLSCWNLHLMKSNRFGETLTTGQGPTREWLGPQESTTLLRGWGGLGLAHESHSTGRFPTEFTCTRIRACGNAAILCSGQAGLEFPGEDPWGFRKGDRPRILALDGHSPPPPSPHRDPQPKCPFPARTGPGHQPPGFTRLPPPASPSFSSLFTMSHRKVRLDARGMQGGRACSAGLVAGDGAGRPATRDGTRLARLRPCMYLDALVLWMC